MLALLSPAKRLDFTKPVPLLPESEPVFARQAGELAAVARRLAPYELSNLMHISPRLARLNHQRFRDFTSDDDAAATRPAVFGFNGDTYIGLRARDLTPDDLAYAQDHLRILSRLYGLLRPLDGIRAHRLEMGSRLANPGGADLYAFWGDRICQAIDLLAAGQTEPVVVNLASREYFRAVRAEDLKARVITPVFKEVRQGYARTLALWAKRARGAMARHMIVNRIEHPGALKDFRGGGYRYQPRLSDPDTWVFTRESEPEAG